MIESHPSVSLSVTLGLLLAFVLGHGFLSGGVNNLVNLLLSVVVAIRAFSFGLVVGAWMLCMPGRFHAIGLVQQHLAIICPMPCVHADGTLVLDCDYCFETHDVLPPRRT